MSEFIDTDRVKVQQFNETPIDENALGTDMMMLERVGGMLRSPLQNIYDRVSSSYKGIATTSTDPESTGSWFYKAKTAGTYTNFIDGSSAPIVVTSGDLDIVSGVANNRVILDVQDNVATKTVERIKGDNRINNFVDGIYSEDAQVLYQGRMWEANSNTAMGDIPGVSDKWDERLDYVTNDKIFGPQNDLDPSLYEFGFYYSDGTGTKDADADSFTTGKQKVNPSTEISFKSPVGAYNKVEFDINGDFVSSALGIGTSGTFNTSPTTEFAALSWLNQGVDAAARYNAVKAGTILNEGPVMAYIPYGEETLADVFYTDDINIANSEKIDVLGNSYTNAYAMLRKMYLTILSMWSDYQFRNFGKDGDDLTEIIARVNANETWLGVVPFKEWGSTYSIIADRDNNDPTDVRAYYNNTKELCELLENLGRKPILSTEHQIQQDMNWFGAYERLHREKGYMFMSWGHAANNLDGAYFPPFWYNRHPGTRTAWLWANGMERYLRTLPRPKKGLKLFRVRASVDTSNVNNLVYADNYGRAEKFNEIAIGQRAITSATQKYFDRMNNPSIAFEDVLDEYQYLQNKTAVAFGSFALVEVILPYDYKSVKKCEINITATGITNAYIKKTINSVDSFEAVTLTSGKIVISDFANVMMYDKIAILLKGSAISISDISAKGVGTAYKEQITKPFIKRKKGRSLLTDTLVDPGTSWIDIDDITTPVPEVDKIVDPITPFAAEEWPHGITTVRKVNDTVFLKQNLSALTSDEYYSLEAPRAQVRVVCRYFPEYVDTDGKYATTTITPDSVDTADLELSIKGDASIGAVPFAVEKVGLAWQEIMVDTILSDFTSALYVKSTSSKYIQIGKVEMVLIEE